jgi:hypothetical protein
MVKDVLFVSERTRVSRIVLPSGDHVICKEALGPGAARRLRHERSMLDRLGGVPGVVQVVGEATDDPHEIVLKDTGGEALATRISSGPMPPAELVPLAEQLAGTIAEMHRRGVSTRTSIRATWWCRMGRCGPF